MESEYISTFFTFEAHQFDALFIHRLRILKTLTPLSSIIRSNEIDDNSIWKPEGKNANLSVNSSAKREFNFVGFQNE